MSMRSKTKKSLRTIDSNKEIPFQKNLFPNPTLFVSIASRQVTFSINVNRVRRAFSVSVAVWITSHTVVPKMFTPKKRDGDLQYSGGDRINRKSTSRPISPTATHKTKFVATISNPIHTVQNDNRPHATVRIFDTQLTGLLDSGANVTVLGRGSDTYINKWSIGFKKKRSTVCTADGSKLTSNGTITLPLEYNGKRKYITTIIVPEISKTLFLGMNFWQAFGIYPSDNTLTSE